MGKLSDIRDALKRRFHQDDSPTENVSMADGIDDTVYGINRRVVYTVIGVIVVAFISFSYFSSSDSGEKDSRMGIKQEEPANKNQMEHKAGMPSDYKELQEMNAKKTGQPNKGNLPAAPNTPASQARPTTQQAGTAPLPQIPQRTYSTPYPVATQQPVQSIAPPPSLEQEKYSSAISFQMGKVKSRDSTETGNSESMSGNPSEVQRASAATLPASPSYIPVTENSLQAGTVFPAVLLTGINTDVGGQVIAQISSDVHDSLSGTTLLIPAGSRLIGSYSKEVKNGQGRVDVVWESLMLPSGGSYTLDGSMIAADYAGYSGVKGHVSHHSGKAIQAGIITSAIAALGAIATGSNDTRAGTYTTGQLAQQGAMSNLINSASSIFNNSLKENTQPTITVEAGSEINVFVTQTIRLSPYPYF